MYCDHQAIWHCLPDSARGVVSYLQVSGIHQHELATNLDERHWLPMYLYVCEWTHQCLDYTTRTTGRFTKCVRMANLDTILFSGLNMEGLRRDARVMETLNECYPEMLDKIFVCQAPSWVQVPYRIMKPLLPKSLLEAFDFISPRTNERERRDLFKYVSEDNLPTQYGGRNDEWVVRRKVPNVTRSKSIMVGSF